MSDLQQVMLGKRIRLDKAETMQLAQVFGFTSLSRAGLDKVNVIPHHITYDQLFPFMLEDVEKSAAKWRASGAFVSFGFSPEEQSVSVTGVYFLRPHCGGTPSTYHGQQLDDLPPTIQTLSMYGNDRPGSSFWLLLQFEDLTAVNVGQNQINDSNIAHVANLIGVIPKLNLGGIKGLSDLPGLTTVGVDALAEAETLSAAIKPFGGYVLFDQKTTDAPDAADGRLIVAGIDIEAAKLPEGGLQQITVTIKQPLEVREFGITDATDDLVATMVQTFPNIEVLYLSGPGVTAESMVSLADGLPNLQRLELDLTTVTTEGLKRLTTRVGIPAAIPCPNLRRVFLNDQSVDSGVTLQTDDRHVTIKQTLPTDSPSKNSPKRPSENWKTHVRNEGETGSA